VIQKISPLHHVIHGSWHWKLKLEFLSYLRPRGSLYSENSQLSNRDDYKVYIPDVSIYHETRPAVIHLCMTCYYFGANHSLTVESSPNAALNGFLIYKTNVIPSLLPSPPPPPPPPNTSWTLQRLSKLRCKEMIFTSKWWPLILNISVSFNTHF
jgi:hypothetical protein